MALLWSGGILAVPGEPVLEVGETDFVLSDSAQSVQVPVTWNRYYGEPALTARYWIDDELALTRTVEAPDSEAEDEAQSGGATLTIEGSGEVELAVSLCDTDGCSDSVPVMVTIIDPESLLRTAESSDADAGMLSFEQAQQIVTESQSRLQQDASEVRILEFAAEQSWGGWFAGFVGQAALKYGLGMGFDALIDLVGLSPGGPALAAELAGIDRSLGEIKVQLDEISRKIDVGKADSDFKNSHREADVAMQNLKTIAGNIAAAEAGVSEPTQFQLESWAKDNRDNIAALRSLLVNSLTGAIPLMLDYYQLKYPVSSGIEVRAEIDGYLDGFRAALGVGLINQAWLTNAFAPNALYEGGANTDALASVDAAYNMAGAPYPQPPSGASGFVHRVGSDWAMVSDDRPQITGQQPVKTQQLMEVRELYGATGAGANAPGDVSIEAYMAQEGVKNSYRPPEWVVVQSSGSMFECKDYVRYSDIRIGGNSLQEVQHTWWTSNGYWCPFPPNGQTFGKQEELRNQFRQTEWATKLAVTTNAWGMPALMDERSIQGHQDGIEVHAITRGDGDTVSVAYDPNGYGWIQVRDPESGSAYLSGVNQAQTLRIPAPSGAVEILQGHHVRVGVGGNALIIMERAIVTTNPGSNQIDLTLDPS
jgi:hypothetical protein